MNRSFLLFARQFIVSSVALGAAFLFVIVAQAWTGPSASAPDNNVPAPVNVGTMSQVKNGGLGVSSLVADTLCLGSNCISDWPVLNPAVRDGCSGQDYHLFDGDDDQLSDDEENALDALLNGYYLAGIGFNADEDSPSLRLYFCENY